MPKRQQYNHVRVTLTATPPPPKTWTTPTYQLERYTIHRNVKTVRVELHGLRGHEKRTEAISFPLLPQITDAELVRAAIFCSPNKWTVPFGVNLKQFNGRFATPLNQQVLSLLLGSQRASSSALTHQTPLAPHEAPTLATTFSASPSIQPSILQPGQFQQTFSANSQSSVGTAQGIQAWYKKRSKRARIGIWTALVVALLLLVSGISAAFGGGNQTATPTPTPTAQQAAMLLASPTRQAVSPTSEPTHVPTPKPTPKPTFVPTHKATPRPTQPPTPTPCPGVNCNPWGYNFSAGKLIYYPPSNFCDYFNCISSFWGSDDPGDGYVVQCVDGTFSQSGGESGACSYHSGVSRPLYSH
jgi:hypothetical protein